jgi:hypothetical protein
MAFIPSEWMLIDSLLDWYKYLTVKALSNKAAPVAAHKATLLYADKEMNEEVFSIMSYIPIVSFLAVDV